MFSSRSSSIIKTLVYADIFDYPLTSHEVTSYLISDSEIKDKVVQNQLRILTDSKQIYTDGEFYFLKGRNRIVELRKKRKGWSKQKWEIAWITTNKLKIIPTIKMIGVTGALAMENCNKEDDIDLLIVTSQNSLWLTRLFLILSAPLLGINRRKPNDINVNNKICFNLFLDEDHLKINPENLFLAHEIVQVKPVFDRGGVYERFIWENRWVRNYLPNAFDSSKFKVQSAKLQLKTKSWFFPVIRFLNMIAYFVQYRYMKSKMTVEKVSLYQAFFHPRDFQKEVETKFHQTTIQIGLDN